MSSEWVDVHAKRNPPNYENMQLILKYKLIAHILVDAFFVIRESELRVSDAIKFKLADLSVGTLRRGWARESETLEVLN